MHIIQLTNDCQCFSSNTKEMLKIIFQHAGRHCKAQYWIFLQDQSIVIYGKLLSHCKTLETWCKHFQKAKEKSWAKPTIMTAAIASTSLIHQDILKTHKGTKCYYSHTMGYFMHTAEAVMNVAGKGASLACVWEWENGPQRMNGTVDANNINLGQDHTAEPGTTAAQGTGLDGIRCSCRGNRSHSREFYGLPSWSNSHSSSPYHNMHYHQDSPNKLHIDRLETKCTPREGILATDTAQGSQCSSLPFI